MNPVFAVLLFSNVIPADLTHIGGVVSRYKLIDFRKILRSRMHYRCGRLLSIAQYLEQKV